MIYPAPATASAPPSCPTKGSAPKGTADSGTLEGGKLDPNFAERLHQIVALAEETGETVCLLIVAIEPQAEVSDTTESFLLETARRIDESIRGFDTATYLGDAKFAILQRAISGRQGVMLLVRGLQTILAEPFSIDGQTPGIDTAIGFSLHAPGVGLVDFLARAETALDQARGNGIALQCYEDIG